MLSKPADVPYCGVRPDVIKRAKPKLRIDILNRHYEWMRDRYRIYLKKDVEGLPAPWTTNPILLNHKFTNTRREHDRQTKLIIHNVCLNPRLSLEDKVLNIIVFRMYNNWKVFDVLGGPWTIGEFMNLDIKAMEALMKAEDKKAGGDAKFYTNAFNTGGLKKNIAMPTRLLHMTNIHQEIVKMTHLPTGKVEDMKYIDARNIAYYDEEYDIEDWLRYVPVRPLGIGKVLATDAQEFLFGVGKCESQDAVYNLITTIRSLSRFLAYQIFVDLTYCPDFKFSENEYTVSGPGCSDGIDRLFEDKDGMTDEECIFWIRDHQNKVYQRYGYNRKNFWSAEVPHDQCMNVMQIENSFCELGKYMKCLDAIEEGKAPRTRVNYDGKAKVEVKKKATKRLW
ncbi:hypothetical protein MYOV003v1_p0105 [Vibrio phage 207E48.1]|nr:hypothetical protein MYOV003v1_p0105 [Vibrio phage 207E48.1]